VDTHAIKLFRLGVKHAGTQFERRLEDPDPGDCILLCDLSRLAGIHARLEGEIRNIFQ
jgi:hypothetical protein